MPRMKDEEDEEATQAHLCFAEFSGGGGGKMVGRGWRLKSLLNIQIKQFQALGGEGRRVLTHVLEKKWGALKSNLKKR